MRSDFCEIMANLARAEVAQIHATHPAHDMPHHAENRLRELHKKITALTESTEYWRGKENDGEL